MENHDNSAYLQAYFYANHIAYVVTDILDMLWLPEQILIAHILLMHALFVLFCTYIFYSFQSPRICPHPLSQYPTAHHAAKKQSAEFVFLNAARPPRSSNPFYLCTKKERYKNVLFCGAPEGIRTPDLTVRSRSLYPAELQAHF